MTGRETHTYGLLSAASPCVIPLSSPAINVVMLNCKAVAVYQVESERHQSMSDLRNSEWTANLTWRIILQGVIHCKKHVANQKQNLEDEVMLKHELPL